MSKPDWSGWPAVHEAQDADVSTHPLIPRYPFEWNLHDNEWTPVTINWLNQGVRGEFDSTLDTGWIMDIMDSNHLWLDQKTESTTWTDTTKGSTVWSNKDYPNR